MVETKDDGIARPLVGASLGRRAKFAQKVQVPVGLEKLLYLAAADPALKKKLLADRDETVTALRVSLRPSEKAMLNAAPPAVLEAMIAGIRPENPRKRKFMGLVAAAATSLAAGTALPACDEVEHDAVNNMDAGGEGPDIDTDAGADAGTVDTDTDTYAGGGARSDIETR